ncbi:DNA recombination protein RmuC homolog [Taylorella asinigenitalis 14/45]|uniref:DNA recombination protein RmuC homolog n=1 Tax=Taylorella asinigenitalis 14/45 TaxID=1091495 RepID=I7J250_9BURK|nr:DNA recombination protein RmuC [Taylorella asinigenitalis]CCG19913.1 DNA recombination protein RmuC homolog [Taylorella asinigenitalis 14/45]
MDSLTLQNLSSKLAPFALYLAIGAVLFFILFVFFMVRNASKATRMAVLEHKAEESAQDLQNFKTQVDDLNIQRDELAEALAGVKSKYEMLEAQATDFKAQRDHIQQAHEEQLTRANDLEKQVLASKLESQNLKENLAKEKAQANEHLQSLKEQFTESRKQLATEFENLSNRYLDEKSKSFSEKSEKSIGSLLTPFREQIEAFQKRVNDVQTQNTAEFASLKTQIETVKSLGIQMSTEASNLAAALKGNKKLLGNWGEIQLETLLQNAGLERGLQYETQQRATNDEGSKAIPDFLVHLPDERYIVIDSKVSLNSYQEAVTSEDPQQTQSHIDAHVRAVSEHIKSLSQKDYANLNIKGNSIGFVFMFMPIEAAYTLVLQQNPKLFVEAYNKGVVLVSQSTLLPTLKTVANIWKLVQSDEQAQEIVKKAFDIYNQLAVFCEHFHKVGNALSSAITGYNNGVTSLIGQQGLYNKVEKFKNLSTKNAKALPQLKTIETGPEIRRLEISLGSDHENSKLTTKS